MPRLSTTLLVALFAALPAATALAQAVPEAVPAPVAAPAEAAAPVAAPAAAPAPATKTPEQLAADRASEIVCRKTLETGSLVKVRKTCHTRQQWAYIEQENKRMGQQFVLDNQGRPSGN